MTCHFLFFNKIGNKVEKVLIKETRRRCVTGGSSIFLACGVASLQNQLETSIPLYQLCQKEKHERRSSFTVVLANDQNYRVNEPYTFQRIKRGLTGQHQQSGRISKPWVKGM